MKIPSNNIWTQTNNGDIAGILHETENCTLDEQGKIKLSRKIAAIRDYADDSDLEYSIGLTYFSGSYFLATTGNGFQFNFTTSLSVAERTLSLDMSKGSDLAVFNDRLYITTDDNLDYFNTSYSLTQSVYALTTGVPHPLCVFESLVYLAVGNANTVVLLNTSHSAVATLTLPGFYEVTSLAYRNGYMYVGTRNKNGGEGKLFVWDGSSSGANYEIATGANIVYAVFPYGSSVAFITNEGQLFVASGNTAVQLAAFPVYYDAQANWDTIQTNLQYKVLMNGACTVGDTIYIVIDGTVDSGFVPEMKDGLWVYDPQNGLYHKAYPTVDSYVVETPSALASNTLTLSTHNLKDGDVLVFSGVGSLTGVSIGKKYYVSVQSSTTVKLCASRKAVKTGQYITVGGSVTGSTVIYTPKTKFAASYNVFAGVVTKTQPEEPLYKGWEAPVLWANGYSESSTNKGAFYTFSEGWNIGRFTTQRIYSQNIKDVWQKLATFFEKVDLDDDKIIVKVKDSNQYGYPTSQFEGVWASATEINSVASPAFEGEWSDIEVGDEIIITDGTGAGYTAHVTVAPTKPSSTWTMTVDESIGTLNDSVYFYADKFKKVGTITNTSETKGHSVETLGNKSEWIQIKIEMRGSEIEIPWLELIHGSDKSAV